MPVPWMVWASEKKKDPIHLCLKGEIDENFRFLKRKSPTKKTKPPLFEVFDRRRVRWPNWPWRPPSEARPFRTFQGGKSRRVGESPLLSLNISWTSHVCEKAQLTSITTGWWFQTLFIFTPKIGEDEPILTHIFQMGWNHQPDKDFKKNRVRNYATLPKGFTFPLLSATVVPQKMECIYYNNVEAPQFEGSVHPGWGWKLSQLYKNQNNYIHLAKLERPQRGHPN